MKVGVIGTGNMGENHVRTYLSMDDHCQFIGIYDEDEQKRHQIAKKYNVKPFQSVDDLLKSVDAVSIAVPTEFHYEIGLACIRHNVHMLMEKPITTTVLQADDLIDKARKANVTFQPGHIELYNPLIQVLINMLTNETIIGAAFHRISPADPKLKHVDVVKDLMIHDIYILNELLQDNGMTFFALGKIIDGTPKHAAAVTRTSQGTTAQLTASSMSGRKIRTIQILTEDAFFEADLLSHQIRITRAFLEKTRNHPVPLTETIQVENSIQPLSLQLLDFLECVESGTEPSVSGENGKQALMIANQIAHSIAVLH
ncbi:Gfo/Idh/MocA family protein [Lentibacillus sp. CBA3610]|uniref:Gfo/Idh/MocA family protein n=1 Tax=Lentibacillus sp. CBA3610 TaxID=2518176 RepID=UPI0015962151|nr:Gfo/Idh/MocA family oxidoreductase [Lentibacillus sp. CBA3610]QKY71111.1 Gfo/Idh/MocA family oxidoreductase [Lentibacillus sp. CBA3610]